MNNASITEKQLIINTLIDLLYAMDNKNTRQICSLLTQEARQGLKEYVYMMLNEIDQNITPNQSHQLLTLFICLLTNHPESLYNSIFIEHDNATLVIEQYRIIFKKMNHFWFINQLIDDSDIYEYYNYSSEQLQQTGTGQKERVHTQQMMREQKRKENLQKIQNTNLKRYYPHQI